MSEIKNDNFQQLVEVMRALRTPETGCPWDLEQNFKTILPYTLEEAYEVADAIDKGDMNALREELGDLLLQPVYHAQMASEIGAFTIDDVLSDITTKMIERHPHVFGEATAKTAGDVNTIWEERKNAEKPKTSALDGIAHALPALLRAQKLTSKAAKTGFKWPHTDFALEKVQEELAELREAIASGNKTDIEEELGDLLFITANLGRMLGLNPEETLRKANAKFERRFKGMEEEIKKKGKKMETSTLAEMEQEWRNQKQNERK